MSGALRVATESLQRLTGSLDPEARSFACQLHSAQGSRYAGIATTTCTRLAQDTYQTANTALLFHGGRLLALQEQDSPYRVRGWLRMVPVRAV